MKLFCKDCKWAKRPVWFIGDYNLRKCAKSFDTGGHPDYTSGNKKRPTMFAQNSRIFGPCGPDAKLFEAR